MIVREDVALAPYTSLSVGGPARFFIEAVSEQDILDAAAFALEKHLPILPLGGGTNILVPDTGVESVVLLVRTSTFSYVPDIDNRTFLLVAEAGASWDALVDAAASMQLWGIENLAGIPGRAAGALVQNIGAYGVEFSSVFVYADVLDTATGTVRRMHSSDARLGYRTSFFKESVPQAGRGLVILRIALKLSRNGSPRLSYADLVLAKATGATLSTPGEIAHTVRTIRAAKFPTAGEGGTAGSFFKNPIVPEEHAQRLQVRFPGLPVYPEQGNRMKLSLAWLFDHALGLKGYAEGPVRLYESQPIVLVAAHGASAANIDAFARHIERRVHEALGIVIEREVELFSVRR